MCHVGLQQTHTPTTQEVTVNINDLMDMIRQQNEANSKTVTMLVGPGGTCKSFTDEGEHGEHDFASYDSSDIHMRTEEWERQGREVAFIEFHAPKKVAITDAQRIAANARLERECPGIKFGSNLSQHKAHEILTSYIGLAEASRLMADA
jgi:hypothetical protein